MTADGRFGWRGWLAFTVGLTCVAGLLVGATFLLGVLGLGYQAPSPHPTPRFTNPGYGYWYCWDSGAPRPHHEGVYVTGDHLCSDVELQEASR